MASLICHDDLDVGGAVIGRPVYVRPIMQPRRWFDGRFVEAVPEDVLPVDLVHRAVVRLFDGEGGEPPAAPDVRVVKPLDRRSGAAAGQGDERMGAAARLAVLEVRRFVRGECGQPPAGNLAARAEFECAVPTAGSAPAVGDLRRGRGYEAPAALVTRGNAERIDSGGHPRGRVRSRGPDNS